MNKNTGSPHSNMYCSGHNTPRKSSTSSREGTPESRGSITVQDQGGGKTEGKTNDEELIEVDPPALPPRPLPRPSTLNRLRPNSRNECNCDFAANPADIRRSGPWPSRSCWCGGVRKYVFLCTLCGALSILLGALFLTVYFMLKSYTTSLNYFETVPTYIPAAMLMTTGFLISCLACRKNRNSVLMKLCGGCSLACAVLCLTVTVTTAVIHMNRLQTLRECYYTQKTLSCTCDSVLNDGDSMTDETVKFVFNSTADCEVIHGMLYSCLRAVFGLSVIGILICIFTCMLVYQLLSHEKKKMYWAQLEMRCRYLYGQHGQQQLCRCCDDCRYPGPTPHDLFPWELMGNRFLNPGRIGNLYTPSPEERGEPHRSGWSWRRLPWARTTGNPTTTPPQTRADVTSPDSQYGFSASLSPARTDGTPYTVIDPRVDCPSAWRGIEDMTEAGFYSWGPPPPYSPTVDSPARRSLSEVLSQASPMRRNNNVSPAGRLARPQQLVRAPISANHTRPIQIVPVRKQPTLPQQPQVQQRKSPSGRLGTLTSAMQLQLSSTENRSNSMTSVAQNENDNYENTSDFNTNNSAMSGFNTLPSLKKRQQPSLANLFTDNDLPRGSFVSISSVADIGRIENLPPRVYLESSDDSRLANDASSGGSHSQLSMHIGRHNDKSGSSDRLTVSSENGSQLGNNSDIYQNEHRGSGMKKKVVRKLEYNAKSSRNAENGKRQSSTDQIPKNAIRRTIPKPPRANPVTPNHGDSKYDNQKLIDNLKLLAKDPDLIRKHGSLIKEFNINSSRGRSNRDVQPSLNDVGFDNFGFQNVEKDPNSSHVALKRTTLQELANGTRTSGNYRGEHAKNNYRDALKVEDGQQRIGNECESDVYFGDISNSSCYMSLRSEEPESLYDEAIELKQDAKSGQALLNKVNLKLIEKESCKLDAKAMGFNPAIASMSPPSLESTGSANSSGCKRTAEDSEHSAGSYCSNRSNNYRNYMRRESNELDPNINEVFLTRDQMRPPHFNASQSRETNGPKRVIPIHANGAQLPNQFRPVREIHHLAQNSNDELSSSSLTADSGISSGRNYIPREFYNEKLNNGSLSADSESSLEIAKVTSSGEFSMLFQKQKADSRGERYLGSEGSEGKHSEESENENKKQKMKYYHDHTMSDDSSKNVLKTVREPINEENQAPNPKPRLTAKIQNTSPKPLPRTTIAGNAKRNNNLNQTEDISRYKNFLAPDAQYDSQEARAQKGKPGKIIRDPRIKPALPARPANLPPKPADKGERNFTGAAPSPRRKAKGADSSLGVEFQGSSSHSVNV